MEEANHVINVLTKAKRALDSEDSLELKNLSDQTIHSASVYQHTDYIIIAVIMYALSKLIERKGNLPIANWKEFLKKIKYLIELTISSIEEKKQKQFLKNLQKIKQTIETSSGDMKNLIQEVLRKASINKASKIYEHGISTEKTAKLLGITQWELSEYIGGKENLRLHFNKTIDARERAKMAMEFFK